MRAFTTVVPLVAALSLSACAHRAADPAPGPPPSSTGTAYLPRSHSHNNYDQSLPLFDALARGFASIEVDIVLLDGALYVAHGLEDVLPGSTPTLQTLYLDPLRDVVHRNDGHVYGPSGPPLQLLVDVKTDADPTYAVLRSVLADYSDMLTSWSDGVVSPGAVSIVLSGNRALDRIEREPVRFVAIDGRILDDRSNVAPDAMPLVSADWEDLGPPVERARLAAARSVVEQMHAEGRKVRFWATPENEELWTALVEMGVDYIGTDDPGRLERLLRTADSRAAAAID